MVRARKIVRIVVAAALLAGVMGLKFWSVGGSRVGAPACAHFQSIDLATTVDLLCDVDGWSG